MLHAEHHRLLARQFVFLARRSIAETTDYTKMQAYAAEAFAAAREAERQHRILLFDEGLGSTSNDDALTPEDLEIVELMLHDACAHLSVLGSPREEIAACSAALSGVMTRGLHTTLTQIISVTGTHLLLRLNATVDANGVGTVVDETGATVPYSVRDELDSDLFRDVVELDTHFLLDGLEHIVQLYKAEGQRTLTSFNSFALGFSIVTVVALVALFVLVKLPHISVMDTDMKRLRGVLLLLPIQVVRAVPSIRVLNRTIARQHHKPVGKLDDTTKIGRASCRERV